MPYRPRTKSNQLDLLSKDALRYAKSWSHGGESLKKRRKIKRPLLPRKITHVVLKSSKAKGKLSFLANSSKVHSRLRERAKRFHIRVHQWVNMGNHLHLKISTNDTKNLQLFLRTFAGLLARDLTDAHKGFRFGKFWDGLAYTRVIHSALEELGLRGYFEGNHRQRELGYSERKYFLNEWNGYLKRLRSIRAKSKAEAELVLSLN